MFYLEKLHLKGFRNYHDQQLQFHPRLNLLVGDNAQGKTNLLEAIYYLSVTRSFRTNRDQELANFDDRYFYLKGIFFKNDFYDQVQISYRYNDQLKFTVNNNRVKRFENLHKYPVVVFSPDDLQVIREGPSFRRRFLNLEGSKLSPLYFKDLKDYQRVVTQRNALLKTKSSVSQLNRLLEPWDQSLVELGVKLIASRIELTRALEEEAQIFFSKMTSAGEQLKLHYHSTVKTSENQEQMVSGFLKQLVDKRELEYKRGTTMVGPHLDDLKISINGIDSRRFSSQGQKRTAALALKMAEIRLFWQRNQINPIILLDDVFSEFDSGRKKHLLQFLRETAGQCFISTATGYSDIINQLQSESMVFKVKQGNAENETDQHLT